MANPPESLPFAPAEYDARLDTLREATAERGLDAVILSGPENHYYLSGYETTGFHSFPQNLIVAADGRKLMVTRQLEVENATEAAYDLAARGYGDTEDPGAALAAALRDLDLGVGRLGVEMKVPWLTVEVFQALGRELPGAELVDVSGMLERMRAVKSAAEIAYMRAAARCVEAGMRAGIETVAEGATEHDVAAAVFHARIKAGSHFVRNPSYIVAGLRSALGHATWLGRTIERGDVVYFELGGNVRHYDAALMRSAVAGPATDEMKRVLAATLEALEAVMATMGPGVPAREVDATARATLDRHGYGALFDHRTGYGIGIEFLTWIERGGISLDAGSEDTLAENMTCHVIPFFKVPGQYSIGMSETLLVTADGCEALTRFERTLFER